MTTKEESETLLSSSNNAKGSSRSHHRKKSREEKNNNALPIQNVIFKSSGSMSYSSHDRHESLESFTDKDLGHAKQQSSPWTTPQVAPQPSATSAQAAAAAASYEYQQQQQQQQAYYAQQFYMQQQQQRYPGYVPWPAPGAAANGGGGIGIGGGAGGTMSHPFFTQQQQQMPPPPPRSNGNNNSNAIKATLSQGSDPQDDEYAALLQKTLGGYGTSSSGGYGATNTTTASTTTSNNTPRNGRVSPAGSNGSGSISNSKRSNSGPAGGGPPPPPGKLALLSRPKHRRAQSDTFCTQQQQQQHPLKRGNSKAKPPMATSKSPRFPSKTASAPGSSPKPTHHRSRSLSASGAGAGGSGSGTIDGGIISGALPSTLMKPQRPTHRRCASNASSAACSVASEASFMSIKSDIRKSSFYGGVDKDTGETQLHYPNEHIYVCPVDDHPTLKVGKVYKLAVDDEEYEEYHRQAEDAMWEDDLEFQANGPHKTTNGTRRNRDPFGALPSNQFALAVDPTVYKRVLEEIGQSQQMPCGLFFCGHHEDVDRPSVGIATFLVISLFLSLGYWAYVVESI